MHHFAKIVRRLNSPNMQPPMLMALSLISVLLLAAGLTWYGFRVTAHPSKKIPLDTVTAESPTGEG